MQTNRIRKLHVVLIFLVDIVISDFDIDDYFVGTMDVSFLHQGSDIYIYTYVLKHIYLSVSDLIQSIVIVGCLRLSIR